MHKDVSTGHNCQNLITSYIQSIKQQSKVLTYYFRTSLLKSSQLIISNQDKQSNIFSTQGPGRPTRKT